MESLHLGRIAVCRTVRTGIAVETAARHAGAACLESLEVGVRSPQSDEIRRQGLD
jgi:hypothetical protein